MAPYTSLVTELSHGFPYSLRCGAVQLRVWLPTPHVAEHALHPVKPPWTTFVSSGVGDPPVVHVCGVLHPATGYRLSNPTQMGVVDLQHLRLISFRMGVE